MIKWTSSLKGSGDKMSISSRITETVEGWAVSWGDRLKGWIASGIGWGIEIIMDVIANKAAPALKPMIEKMEATGEVPPEIQPLLDEIKNPTGELGALLAQSAGSAVVGGSLGRMIDAIMLPFAYGVNKITRNVILNEQQFTALRRRHLINPDELDHWQSLLGLNKQHAAWLYDLSEARLDPQTVAKLWVRDKDSYEQYWDDLQDQGVTQDRITVLKELAHAIPTVQEVVHFMAKEAFEEDAVTKYGLDAEFERIDLKWFEQAGIRPEIAKLYWRSHWVHPAWGEMTELLHRGEVTKEDIYEWYRLVEIPPHWRDKLTSISWDLPNRIELRMMARYGLVDKAFLVEQLKLVGLREDFRDITADMMLAMGIRTDLSTRYSKGWLDAEGVRSELAVSGLSPEVADRMYQWIVKNVSGERVAKERDLTLTDIYKGIKKGTVTRQQGADLIKDMGYDDWEVEVKLSNNVPIEETVTEVKERELTKADVLRLLKAKKIDEPEALTRLMNNRYSEGDSQLLISLVEQTTEVIVDEKQRELTKIDIIKAVKAGVVTQEEGYMMMLDVGYTPKDAEIIFQTRIEAVAGSPDTFNEFKKMTQVYRASQGKTSVIIPDELIMAEREVKIVEAALRQGKATGAKPKRLAELERAVEDAKIAYHQLPSPPEVSQEQLGHQPQQQTGL